MIEERSRQEHRAPAGRWVVPVAFERHDRTLFGRVPRIMAGALHSAVLARISRLSMATAMVAGLFLVAGPVGSATASSTGAFALFDIPDISSTPEDIAKGPDGNMWFTERAANRISRITPAGVITEFAVPTGASMPAGITLGPDGNMWFVEIFTDKIGRITPSGVITAVWIEMTVVTR